VSVPHAWRLRREAPAGLRPWLKLGQAWALDEGASRLAWMRGVDEPEELAWRLDATWARSTDPHLLPGVDAAVARIRKSIEAGERITIYGDYDVDGVTATALLMRVLEKLGAQVDFFIPNRFNDGYGLNLDCIRELKEARHPGLIISVDCGVRSVEEVRASAELGLAWVITDHHALGAELPPASAVVHPLLDGYANPWLSGVGVAFKLAQALLGAVPVPTGGDAAFLDGLLKLVAIGTVADMVPLKGENALLVRRGLEALAGANGPGLVALLKAARVEGRPTGQDLAFGIGPRLNAVGRMGGAEDAVRLLLCRDAKEAESLMIRVEALNQERKQTQRNLAQHLPPPSGEAFDLVVEADAHKGVIGIVAGARMRDSGKPTAVCTVLEGVAHCSLRAPEGFDLTLLLEQAKPFLRSGGGHRLAAGMTFPLSHLAFVRQCFEKGAREQAQGRSSVEQVLDGWGPDGFPAAAALAALEPWWQGFPVPMAGLEGVLAEPVKAFGEGHWKLKLQGVPEPLTWFFGADRSAPLAPGDHLRLAATPQDQARWGRSWLVEGRLS
jgi:single-stranded-DNA-specific exonuclease